MSDNETIINLLRTANDRLAAQGNEPGGGVSPTAAPAVSALEPMLKKGISGVGGVLSGIMNMPKELLEASARDVSTLGDHNFEKETAGPAAEMAMNLAGGGMPMAEKGAAGIFGGRLAQTADLKALQEAERMRMHGLHPADVRADTGWFRTPTDGKWKFEIPDNRSKLNVFPDKDGDALIGSYKAFLDHPDMFKAYPQIGDYRTRVQNNQGQRSGMFDDFATKTEPKVFAEGPNRKDIRSVLLHEGQHGIQTIEDFARGADPDHYARLIEQGFKKNPERYQAYDFDALKKEADSLYHKTAGEVESRNVQHRMDYFPAERAAVPPWETQDVRFKNQVIFDPVRGVIEALRNK